MTREEREMMLWERTYEHACNMGILDEGFRKRRADEALAAFRDAFPDYVGMEKCSFECKCGVYTFFRQNGCFGVETFVPKAGDR